MAIEWLNRAEDNESLVLRVVNWGATSAEANVETACPSVAAWRSSHLEDPGSALPSNRSGFRVRLRANEIATVVVDCAQ